MSTTPIITAKRDGPSVTVYVNGEAVHTARTTGKYAIVTPWGDWVAGDFRQRRNMWTADFASTPIIAEKRRAIMRRRCMGKITGIYGDYTIVEVQ